ncbi:MAG TPA: pyruvate kinase, partial [Methylophaga aminisulfidivorans]|nr:pyruvate kinase [Methylophaga aminisulfidivorans]
GIPIFALTRHQKTVQRLTLYRGVYPLQIAVEHNDHALMNKEMVSELLRRGVVSDGDIVIITKGDLETQGSTNALKIVTVGNMVEPV